MYYAVLVAAPQPPRRRRRHSLAMLIVSLLGLPLGAGAVGRAIDFLPAVQAQSQNARVNVANLKDLAGGVPPGPCAGSIAFYDAAGTLLGGSTVKFSLMPGSAITVGSPFVNALGGARPRPRPAWTPAAASARPTRSSTPRRCRRMS
jgi:hypothetical protein